MEHHYIVVYNDESKLWHVDVDTAMAFFEDIGYWHNGEEWTSDVSAKTQELYLEKEEALANLINWAQGE